MQTKLPKLYVTNYQQYINAEVLQEAIFATLTEADLQALQGEERLYISIAYIDVKKTSTMRNGAVKKAYATTLVVSVKGITRRYAHVHENEDFYLAKKGLDLNQYAYVAAKDNHIRLIQQAFFGVLRNNIGRITSDLVSMTVGKNKATK